LSIGGFIRFSLTIHACRTGRFISGFNYEILIISFWLIKTPSSVLYITMYSRKGKIFIFLFIFYFLFYAVSPLSHSLTQLDGATVTTGEKNCETKGVYLLFGELIWSKLFQQEECPDSSGNNRLLIKKARAVLNSNDTVKTTQNYAIANRNTFVLPVTRAYADLPENPVSLYESFYSLFSGLSPPSCPHV